MAKLNSTTSSAHPPPTEHYNVHRSLLRIPSSIAVKGHCVMYTANGRHFEVPLVYQELLRMSQKDWLCKRWQDHIAL
uniref:Uncharacterized protein n=1 Tax=Aegilops tauschii subsp. strangulata TaxID=200361 RepID=A0A453LJ38_AEGTS